MAPAHSSFELSASECETLRLYALDRGWTFQAPGTYVLWQGSSDGVKIICYTSGKAVIQGKGAQEFIRYTLETLIPRMGGVADLKSGSPAAVPEGYVAHAGMDESGKGDFFGPLCVTSAYVGREHLDGLSRAGVRDCKEISDKELFKIDAQIKAVLTSRCFSTVVIGSEAYNRLYAQFANLNRLLAWGHARALENLLTKVPECKEAIADQFGNPALIKRALQERGRTVHLVQRTKAESDIAVAAASVLARAEFLRRLKAAGEIAGMNLPKGAGAPVLKAGRELWKRSGGDASLFAGIAKTHFSTYIQIQCDG